MPPVDLDSLLLSLTLQIALIIATARLLGFAFRRVQQPQVIGEVVAGILLGPSFLGTVAPGLSAWLFPESTLPFLKIISEYGIVFFMFLIGLELNPALLRNRGRTAVTISAASIVLPFLLGGGLALALYDRFAGPEVSQAAFALFLGAAMSITAFPVLARILIERDLLRSRIGALTLTCAAVDDIVGWCILAVVVALGREGSISAALPTYGWIALYIAVMVLLLRPLLKRLAALHDSRGGLSQNLFAAVLVLVLGSALATEAIGIHAIFGGFMLGAMMPKEGDFVRSLVEKTEDFAIVFFLPVYFAYSGLRTQISLLNSWDMWIVCGVIVATAVAGKLGGTLLAGRALHLTWREAAALGTLINTRGLMELVILNVGLDLGVITPTVFAMMVVMAIVTTLMTTPALAFIYPAEQLRAEALQTDVPTPAHASSVLVPVALPSSGPRLLALAAALADGEPCVYALHLERPVERGALGGDTWRNRTSSLDALRPAIDYAQQNGVEVRPIALISRNPEQEICEVARTKAVSLIVMGWHKPIFGRSVLSGTVERVMRRAEADVAVFIDKGLPDQPKRLLLPYTGGRHEQRALLLATRLARRHRADLTLLHVVRPSRDAPRLEAEARALLDSAMPEPATGATTRLQVVESVDPVETVLREAAPYDLTILGVGDEWRVSPHLFGLRPERIATECPSSLLIVRAGTLGAA